MKPELERELLAQLEAEKSDLDKQTIYLTPNVSYTMNEIVQRARKNHLGVFDEPRFPSGHAKPWIPITEVWDESSIAAIDIDTKDIKLIPFNEKSYAIIKLLQLILRAELKRMGTGKILNLIARYMVIDGTAYVKAITAYSKKCRRIVSELKLTDFFNISYDYKAESLDSTPIYETFYLTQEQVAATDWDNKDSVSFTANIDKSTERNPTSSDNPVQVPEAEFNEIWRPVQRKYLTGNEEDTDYVEAQLIVSNLNKTAVEVRDGKELEVPVSRVHKIVENPFKNEDGTYRKPYQEFIFRKVIGRHPGRGMPEALFDIQLHANMNAGTRFMGNLLRNSLIAKFNPSSTGLKPGDLMKLGPTGEIPLNGRLDDFQFIQMPMAPDSQGEMNQIMDFAQRYVPSVLQGASTPGEKPTTSLIRNQNAQGLFGQIREDFALAFTQLLEAHILPSLVENLASDITITGTQGELDEYDEAISELRSLESASDFIKANGYAPTKEQRAAYKSDVRQALTKFGDVRPLKLNKKLKGQLKELAKNLPLHAEIAITDESIDKAVVAQKLGEAAALIAQANPQSLANLDAARVMEQEFNLLGVPLEPIRKKAEPQLQTPGQLPTGMEVTDMASLAANAGLPQVAQGEELTSQVTGMV